jgi:SulP family sulfate permease
MKIFHEFIPKSYLYLRKGYTFAALKKDLFAGITVGIIALPLAMAFGIASGVSPERGLFTAIVAGFLISALGGSRVQIGGPTGAFVVLVYDIVQRTGYEGLAVSTLIASLFLILLAIFRLGSWIKYVPHPLITGFTTGLALIIFSSQVKDFFGLKMGVLPADFVDKWESYFHSFSTFDSTTLLLGVGTLAFILFMRRFVPKIPWGIAAIVVATLICSLFNLPVETIQTKFGPIPHSLPFPSLPSLSFPLERLDELLMDAIAIAFLGGIESLLSCVISDGMIGGRHKSNCELMGQGIANFASVLFGGIPATGAIARTAANVKSGAQSPMAGMIHAITLLAIITFLSPIASQIPLAALAAILMMVAWNMSELSHFIRMMRAPAGDVAILVTAFFLTVLVDITFAIAVGMILASFLFMKRMSEFSKTVPLSSLFREKGSEFPERTDPESLSHKHIPEGVEVFEIQGPFFFAAADMLRDLAHLTPKVFILRMRHVPMVDASGMHALKEFYQRCQSQKIPLLLSGIQTQTAIDLDAFGLTALIGPQCIFPHIDAALTKAEELVGATIKT